MKWVLIVILIVVIMLIAYSVSEQYKEKFDFYFNLKNFLNQFKLNLNFKQEKINNFIEKVKSKKQFNIFLDEYKNYLKTNKFNLDKIKILTQQEKNQLEEIIKNIGQMDLENEKNQLDTFIFEINKNLEQAQTDKNKLCPMIIKLSLLFAIGLAIILI